MDFGKIFESCKMVILVLTIWVTLSEIVNLYYLKTESIAFINIPLLLLGAFWCGYQIAKQKLGLISGAIGGLITFAIPTYFHAFVIRILTDGFPTLEAVAVYIIAGILLSILGLVSGLIGAFVGIARQKK